MSSAEKLRQAAELARNGQQQEARKILVAVLKGDPKNEAAWMGLASISSPPERVKALKRVLQINPNNTKAREVLARTEAKLAGTAPAATQNTTPATPFVPDKPVNPFQDDADDLPDPYDDMMQEVKKRPPQGASTGKRRPEDDDPLAVPDILADVDVPDPLVPAYTLAVVSVVSIVVVLILAVLTSV